MNQRRYDHHAADKLEDAVLKRYPSLSHSARHVILGLRRMERKHSGFCKPLARNVSQFGREFGLSENTVSKALNELGELKLIEHEPGQAVLNGAATQIRRCTLKEIETGVPEKHLRNHTPVTATEIIQRLKGRSINYDGKDILPTYNPAKTGRIYMAQCRIQQESSEERTRKATMGLAKNEHLVELDIKQAEPTVIREVLRREKLEPKNWPDDVYQLLASLRGVTRQDAKTDFLRLCYCPNTLATLHAMHLTPGTFIYELGQNLDKLKSRLWVRGKPSMKKRRHVYTLGRTLVEALKGDRTHKGDILSWLAQGTVADIINATILKILDDESTHGWRFLFQIYDSVYVACTEQGQSHILQDILEQAADKIGIKIRIECANKR